MNKNFNRVRKNVYKGKAEPTKKTFINKMGIKLAALALALGIGSYTLMDDDTLEEIETKTNTVTKSVHPKETITLALTNASIENRDETEIPIFKSKDGKSIIATIDKNTLIISKETFEDNLEDTQHNLHLVSAITPDDQVITGYIYRGNLSNITYLNNKNSCSLYKVTSGNGINLRTSPELGDNKLVGIPTNSILLGSIPNRDTNDLWTKVVYFNGTSISEGYASGKYLEKVAHIVDKQKKKNIDLDYDVENDNVVGIDVSHLKPEILDNLLKGNIELSSLVENRYGEKIDISDFAEQKINFVYIKLFGSSFMSKELKKGKDTPYIKLAQICEDNNIPYGFYYYSTCTNPVEARQEYKWISDALKKLDNSKYHLLPFAIDVEVHSDKDRQNKVPVEQLTNSKIILANLLENDFGKTILYTSRNACDSALASKILDIEQYQRNLNSGESHIWFVSPEDSKAHKNSMNKFKDYVRARQIALDVKTGKSRYNLIDINIIQEEAFKKYISGEYKNYGRIIARDKMLYTAELDLDER